MDADRIGLCGQFAQLQATTSRPSLLGSGYATRRDDVHLQTMRPPGHGRADAAHPNNPQGGS